MVKTITIKDSVYKKLVEHKGENESFSDLFERLMEENFHSNIDTLKKIRGSIDFDKEDKDSILKKIGLKRDERRI